MKLPIGVLIVVICQLVWTEEQEPQTPTRSPRLLLGGTVTTLILTTISTTTTSTVFYTCAADISTSTACTGKRRRRAPVTQLQYLAREAQSLLALLEPSMKTAPEVAAVSATEHPLGPEGSSGDDRHRTHLPNPPLSSSAESPGVSEPEFTPLIGTAAASYPSVLPAPAPPAGDLWYSETIGNSSQRIQPLSQQTLRPHDSDVGILHPATDAAGGDDLPIRSNVASAADRPLSGPFSTGTSLLIHSSASVAPKSHLFGSQIAAVTASARSRAGEGREERSYAALTITSITTSTLTVSVASTNSATTVSLSVYCTISGITQYPRC